MELVTSDDRDAAMAQALKDVPCGLTCDSPEEDVMAWRAAFQSRYRTLLSFAERDRRAARGRGVLAGYRRDLR